MEAYICVRNVVFRVLLILHADVVNAPVDGTLFNVAPII